MSLIFLLEKHLSELMVSLEMNFLLLQYHQLSFHFQVGKSAWLLLCTVLAVDVVICKMATIGMPGINLELHKQKF